MTVWNTHGGCVRELSMNFTCPNCAAALEVGDEMSGRQAQCPFCLKCVAVPRQAAKVPTPQLPRILIFVCAISVLLTIGCVIFRQFRQPVPPWGLVPKHAELVEMIATAPAMGIDVRDSKIQPPKAPDGYVFYSDFDSIVFGRDQVFAWKPKVGRVLIVTCGFSANGIMPKIDGVRLVVDHARTNTFDGFAEPYLRTLTDDEVERYFTQLRLQTNEVDLKLVFRVPGDKPHNSKKLSLRVAWRDENNRHVDSDISLGKLTITNGVGPAKVTWNTNFVRSLKESFDGGGANQERSER